MVFIYVKLFCLLMNEFSKCHRTCQQHTALNSCGGNVKDSEPDRRWEHQTGDAPATLTILPTLLHLHFLSDLNFMIEHCSPLSALNIPVNAHQ